MNTAIAGSGHTARMGYATNNSTAFTDLANTRRVALYQVSLNSAGVPTLNLAAGTAGYYAANELYLTISKDENWDSTATGFNLRLHTTEEYKDKEGKVVLKRTFNLKGSTQEILSTYYVYDDFGNLTYVLPPGSAPDRASLPTGTALNTWLKSYGYQYRYDSRNRMSYKRVPGTDTSETFNYNLMDQVVFHQDSRQQKETYTGFTPGKYHTFYKYDALGRQIITGVERNVTGTRDQIDTIIGNWGYQWDSRSTASGNLHGYTNQSIPNAAEYMDVLEVNYYDTYDDIPGLVNNVSASYSKMTQGLLVATKVKVLGTTSTYLWTVNYYNDRGELVRCYKQHYQGGVANVYNYDDITNTYTFTGKVLTSTRKHYTGTTSAALQLTVTTTYTYDHRERLLDTKETISPGSNTGTPTLLARNVYNEVGQLRVKKLHSTNSGSTFADSVKYAYNARGWLKENVSPKFKEYLNYQETGTGITPQWNGNISRQQWQQGTATAQNYFYQYDAINRLTQGSMTGGIGREVVQYDNQGNIQKLGRTGTSAAQEDTLTYAYSGNRLTSVADANIITDAAYQLPGTTTYTYDANGNMKSRLNTTSTAHNISSMVYNYLNLPQTVTVPSGTITYTYDGTGRKLRTVGGGITTEYIDGIEWQDGTLNLVHTDEGRAINTGSAYAYEYFLKDHLGNTRSGFAASSTTTAKFVTEYYPFGLTFSAGVVASPKNRYLYNGKELQDGSNLYDYGARSYDPVIGRFSTLDPKSDDYYSYSPFTYVGNNPIRRIDPDGQDWRDILKGIVAAVVDNHTGGTSNIRNNISYQDASDYNLGQDIGDITSALLGGGEMVAGGTAAAGGVVATIGSGGTLVLAGGAAVVGGTSMAGEGAVTAGAAMTNFASRKGRVNESNTGSRQGKDFTRNEKEKVKAENSSRNNGKTVCEQCGVKTTRPEKSQRGVTPPKTDTQVDHKIPKSKGGSGTAENGQVLCRECNIKKSNKIPEH